MQESLNEVFPLPLPLGKRMSAPEFFRLASTADGVRLEREADGTIMTMSPSGFYYFQLGRKLQRALEHWSETLPEPGAVIGADAGITLPNGAVRSPDAGWVSQKQLNACSQEQLQQFPPLAPECVIKVLSPTDSRRQAKRKMQEYMNNGVKVGWLIDAHTRQVHVFGGGGQEPVVQSWDEPLTSPEVLPGFSLVLRAVTGQI